MANPELVLECCICLESYDTNFRKPCIGVCGHTICTLCRDAMATSNCPHCNLVKAFAACILNSQMLEIMTAIENIPKCASCKRASKKLRICVPCHSLPTITDENAANVLHEFAKLAICGECIFEENHGEHETILINSLSSSADNAASLKRIDGKFNSLENCSSNIFDTIDQQFSKTCQILEKFCSKNMSLENIEAAFERFEDVMFDFQQCGFRFQRIKKQIDKQHRIVKETNKAYEKPPSQCSPILFACLFALFFLERFVNFPVVSQDLKMRPLIFSFDMFTQKLETKGAMQNPLSACAVASSEDGLYIIGGKLDRSESSSVELYKQTQNYRKTCENLRTARSRAAAAFHNGKVYVCGGWNKNVLRDVEIFCEDAEEWVEGPPLIHARANCVVKSADGDLYVIGGIEKKCYVKTVEKLNKETGKFEIVASMNERSSFASCATSGKIHIVGGVNSESQCLQTYETFDLVTRTWTSQPNMQAEGYCIFLYAFKENMFAFKKVSDAVRTVLVEVFNFNTQQWKKLEQF